MTIQLKTHFYSDERCFWHGGGNYAQMLPVGGFVQPLVSGGLPEAPETKRRLKNLIEVTGLSKELHVASAEQASDEDLKRIHPDSYLTEFQRLSAAGGGELGQRTPFGPGGYEIAALSAGLVKAALFSVLKGQAMNAYALSRPPGHHCLPDFPNGFCLLANIPIAIEAARAAHLVERIAVVDWDVHHGNGTEAIYYDDPNCLTISMHQERCYPPDTGQIENTGEKNAVNTNMNIPLPPGSGHATYLEVMERLVIPKLRAFKPELIVVACGFDAASNDPLARMMCSSMTFRRMTEMLMAETQGKLVAAHEGGYSEIYVPFCGHAVLEQMSGSSNTISDPLLDRINGQQPNTRMQAFLSTEVSRMVDFFKL
jgi:acetoin utilization deacetylase AcuC-like enzyme